MSLGLRQKAAAYVHRDRPSASMFGADTDFGDETTGQHEMIGRLIVYDESSGLKHRVIALHGANNPRLVHAVARDAGTMFDELEAVATLLASNEDESAPGSRPRRAVPFAETIMVYTDAPLKTDAELVRAFADEGLRIQVVFDAGEEPAIAKAAA